MADEYISRKAAMEYLYRAINADPDGNCPSCIHDEHDCQYDRCWTLMDFCEKIEYLGYVPAADVVPVRHGEWFISINANDRKVTGTICPICGFAWAEAIDAVKLEPSLSLIKTPYCPNCGTKMDGEA